MNERFVILRHTMPPGAERPDHWDLMLPSGEVLITWAIFLSPDGQYPLMVERLADHRTFYLDYEGEVSGNRGSVARWDRGTCEIERVDEDQVMAIVQGMKMAGRVSLTRRDDGSNLWDYCFRSWSTLNSTHGELRSSG